MKAVVKVAAGPGHVEMRDVPRPRPGTGEVLLEVGAAGVCGTDLHIFADEYPCRPPVILGHEFAGTVVELGSGVDRWQIGDRVVSTPFATVCGTCRYCTVGEFGLCEARLSYGSGVDGALAEYVAVRDSGLYRIPEHQDFIDASITEPLACVAKAVFGIAALQSGEGVVILGPGPIGLLATQVARAGGARVALVGLRSDRERLQLGRRLGAAHAFHADDPALPQQVNNALGPGGADVVFECSGAGDAFTLAMQLVRKQGRLIQIGLFGNAVESDLDLIVLKDLTVRGSFTSTPGSWERALDLIGSGQVDTGSLVSHVFPLEDWEAAFRCATNRGGLKVVLQPSKGDRQDDA